MSFISEKQFEQEVIKRISNLGWKYFSQQEILKLRNDDTTMVILESKINEFLKIKINIQHKSLMMH